MGTGSSGAFLEKLCRVQLGAGQEQKGRVQGWSKAAPPPQTRVDLRKVLAQGTCKLGAV